MKNLVIGIMTAGLIMLGAGSAMAFGNTTHNHHNNYDYSDNSVSNAGGQGGDATIERGAIDNDNRNTNLNTNLNSNSNRNENSNRNTAIQGQGQAQGQLQGQTQGQVQGQDQGQSQSANNEGNFQKITQTFEAKRDFVQGPEIVVSRPVLASVKPTGVRAVNGLFDRLDGIKLAEINKIAKGLDDDDIELKVAVLYERMYRTTYVANGASGDFMGTITAMATGADCTVAGLEAAAIKTAMELGATHVRIVTVDVSQLAVGSAWNVGIGGGASIATTGTDAMVAPNGGIGYGEATAETIYAPSLIIELFSDESVLVDSGIYKGQTGNHKD